MGVGVGGVLGWWGFGVRGGVVCGGWWAGVGVGWFVGRVGRGGVVCGVLG